MESVGDHGKTAIGDEVGLGDNSHIVEFLDGDVVGEELALFQGGVMIKVKDVAMERVRTTVAASPAKSEVR